MRAGLHNVHSKPLEQLAICQDQAGSAEIASIFAGFGCAVQHDPTTNCLRVIRPNNRTGYGVMSVLRKVS